MKRNVELTPFQIIIESDTGYFHRWVEPGTAKEVGDSLAKLAKYLKAANHAKTGLTNIKITINQGIDL